VTTTLPTRSTLQPTPGPFDGPWGGSKTTET